MSEFLVYEKRARICDLGYLRHPYRKEDGSLGYRCPAEPVEDYLRKGGALAETEGRKCVCNGLLSTIGLAQVLSDRALEPVLMTAGDDAVNVARFLKPGCSSYSAQDVIDSLLGKGAVAEPPGLKALSEPVVKIPPTALLPSVSECADVGKPEVAQTGGVGA